MSEKKEYSQLYQELEMFEDNGINIRLNGKPVSALQAVQAHMICEVGAYMRDYVLDGSGHVSEILFDIIK